MKTSWREIPGGLVRLKYHHERVTAVLYPPKRKLYGDWNQRRPREAGRNVLGVYKSAEDAMDAAKALLAMTDEDRLCTPRDIDRVRKDIAAKGSR